MATVDHPTYLSLDVPEPMAERVRAMRRRFDPDFADLPVEIALTGSSGVGVIDPKERLERVMAVAAAIAASAEPITTHFSRAAWAGDLNVHALLVDAVPPLTALHDRLAACGIRFAQDCPDAFMPHCALRWSMRWMDRGQRSDWEALIAPHEPFVLRSLVMHRLRPGAHAVEAIARWALGDRP